MDKLGNKKIAIIGSGHIAFALVEGLIRSGVVMSSDIIVSNPSGAGLTKLQKKFGVEITKDNKLAVKKSNWIFLAVKPFVIKEVLREIKEDVKEKIVFSLAAGVDMRILRRSVEVNQKLIRIMPNIAIAVNKGVIGMFANDAILNVEKREVFRFFSLVGFVIEVKQENEIDLLTLLSGCGSAIVSNFITLYSVYGRALGLSKEISEEIVLQTFAGTIAYLKNKRLSSLQLQQSVATKGGITEAILSSLKKKNFEKSFFLAMERGRKKLASHLSSGKAKEILNHPPASIR